MIEQAINLAARGFHIFPVQPMGKTPHLIHTHKPYTIRWSETATRDVAAICRYWDYSPNANIGVACKQSSILVVDCDAPKQPDAARGTAFEDLHIRYGPWLDGSDCLRELCTRMGGDWNRDTATYRVGTGSLGCHYYYRWPAGVQASQASIVRGLLDIRCNGGTHGGYVLGAGSVTTRTSGTVSWLPRGGPYIEESAQPMLDAPGWLVDVCQERPATTVSVQQAAHVTSGGTGSMVGLVQAVLLAPDGNLNSCLLWAARCACSDGIPVEQAVAELASAYATCGGRGGYRQGDATVRSGYRLQQQKGT